jgi:hypothetical protein
MIARTVSIFVEILALIANTKPCINDTHGITRCALDAVQPASSECRRVNDVDA